MSKVTIEVTIEQAQAIQCALETYSRLCIGQFEHVADLCRDEIIPVGGRGAEQPRTAAHEEVCDEVETLMRQAKLKVGYPFNGASSIGNPHVHVTGHRAWEVGKVIAKALSEHRDPAPAYRGPDYNGRIVAYTDDPDAVVRIGA